MPDFSRRAQGHELLDDPSLDPQLLHRNLYELDVINRWLGGHAATLRGVKRVLRHYHPLPHRPLTIIDVGCGGGDTLRVLYQFLEKKGWPFRLIGIDLNEECLAYARQSLAQQPYTSFLHADARALSQLGLDADVVVSSLFTHHLFGEDLPDIIGGMYRSARLGMVINDLHRHPLAYHSIALLTKALSRSPLVKHDAPLSVARGFSAHDWRHIMHHSNIPRYHLQWIWAFRWCVTATHTGF